MFTVRVILHPYNYSLYLFNDACERVWLSKNCNCKNTGSKLTFMTFDILLKVNISNFVSPICKIIFARRGLCDILQVLNRVARAKADISVG